MATPPPISPSIATPISTPAPVPEDRSRVAPVWHTVVFIVVTLALTGYQAHAQPKIETLQLRNRAPLYLVMIAFELLMLLYVWLGVRSTGTKVRDIVGGKWKSFADFWVDAGVAMGFWVVVVGLLIAMSLMLGKNSAGTEAVKALLPRTYTEMVMWVCLSTTAGFCEEFIFRGYLQRQFLALTGKPALAVVFQALIFGAAHLYQGWKGAVTITVYGALFGVLAVWRKSLRPGMMQHAVQDTVSGLIGSYALRHHVF
jgi:membrane protease YdiL (CAAX protease family)